MAVRLPRGGFGLGVIARAPSRGKVLLGYFFPVRFHKLPTLDDTLRFSARDAMLVVIFGDYSLYRREWPVLGRHSRWDRSKWPMPFFARIDEKGKAVRVRYSEDDPSVCIEEKPCSIREAKNYSEDCVLGSHLLADQLEELLLPLP